MTFFTAVTAPIVAPLDLRVVRPVAAARAARFVRLRYATVVNGISGSDEFLIDTATGRFVERTIAGPLSSRVGFDGRRTWSCNATGLAEVDDHPDERSSSLAWAYLFARAPSVPPSVVPLAAHGDVRVVRVRYPAMARGIDVAVDTRRNRVRAAVFYVGPDTSRVTFASYARRAGVVVPSVMNQRSAFGSQTDRLVAAETVRAVARDAFAPPRAPRDVLAPALTTVPFALQGYGLIVVARIDDGPPLRMLLDTGGSLSLTPDAARRSRLRTVGAGNTGGIGPNVVPERYATAHSVRVGGVELRDQPVEVFAFGERGVVDGMLGYELLARRAVRFDFRRSVLTLARDVHSLRPRGMPLRIALEGGQPEVDGAVDEVAGRITIDTGSQAALDVLAPAVREHRLLGRYAAHRRTIAAGIGGTLTSYHAEVGTVRLGAVVVRDVPAELDVGTTGAMADPTVIANAGIPLLARFAVVLDYRTRTMYLEPR